jgi:hypothetical protein
MMMRLAIAVVFRSKISMACSMTYASQVLTIRCAPFSHIFSPKFNLANSAPVTGAILMGVSSMLVVRQSGNSDGMKFNRLSAGDYR